MSQNTALQPNKIPDLGLAAFDSLRAEYEQPWLEQCFVPPPEFDLIAGSRSVVVFGGPGSGKTALYQALRRCLMPEATRPYRLCCEWHPQAEATLERQLDQVLATTAGVLQSHLSQWPSVWDEAPDHAQRTMAWFIRKYRALSNTSQGSSIQAPWPSIISPEVQEDYLEQAATGQIIAELTKALAQIGLQGVCVLVDPDSLGDPEAVSKSLVYFLSTLRLFENPRFIYKLVLPTALESILSNTGGVMRRRLDRYRLRWLERNLVSVVEKRLWLASGGQVEQLQDVCQDETLEEWLARCGGMTPRGWLDQARPLAAHYLDRDQPLTVEEWHRIRRIRPPQLWIDQTQKSVMVGYRQVQELPETEWAILEYLYQHQERICTRDELYHKAHLSTSGPTQNKKRFLPKEYEGALNNALLRLRQAIEPDPKDPLFVVTHRGKGVKLEHAW